VPGTGEAVRIDAGAYGSSMEGLRALSHAADRELSPFGVRVYAVENVVNENVVEAVFAILEKEAK
jgi:NAD(P)-dependent dehydrogenase (short-subunit alcohol dehydrogenase family)